MTEYFLALDIGGTKTSAALFTRDGEIVEESVHVVDSKTSGGEEAVYENTKSLLKKTAAAANGSIAGIGVGSPGPVDRNRGLIVHAPLMGFRNFPVAERLSQDFGLAVRLDKDGNLGALAEQRRGVAQGAHNMAYVTVSTGCGGGIVINGELYHGAHDNAGEFGHLSIDPEGLPCPCGSRGCFELYASGTALIRTMRRDLETGIKSAVFDLAQGKRENITGKLLDQAAGLGDPYALELYRREGYYLGVGLANLCNMLDPEVLVLGGGITKGKEFFHEAMMETLRERSEPEIRDGFVRYSQMNDRVVLYGAFFLVKEFIERE